MQTVALKMPVTEARHLYRAYKKHQHYSEPIDWEIQRAYQLIAQGRMVIRALESIKAAGLNAEGLPKLAIVRSDCPVCVFRGYGNDGSCSFNSSNEDWPRKNADPNRLIRFAPGSFVFQKSIWDAQARTPLIPIHLRPKRGLQNYHVLWEAEWAPIPPRDPLLLRRIGKADLWLVVASWDLTEVERVALATRVNR